MKVFIQQLGKLNAHTSNQNLTGVPNYESCGSKNRFWWNLWVQNDRRHTGEVYRCNKAVKKLFRQVCRRNVSNLQNEEYRSIITSSRTQNLNKFWSSIKTKHRKKNNSSLQPNKVADYYSSIMQDNAELSEKQQRISIDVHNKYKNNEQFCTIEPSLITDLISRLERGSSPGVDGWHM